MPSPKSQLHPVTPKKLWSVNWTSSPKQTSTRSTVNSALHNSSSSKTPVSSRFCGVHSWFRSAVLLFKAARIRARWPSVYMRLQ